MNTFTLKPVLVITLLTLLSISNSHSANAPWVGNNLSNAPCLGKSQGYGPFDYLLKSRYQRELILVEGSHFVPKVENLIGGNRGQLIQDLDYTLRAWPNHHRALNSISKYVLLFPNKKKPVSLVECYFQRAINFSPKDSTTKMLYGMYLHKRKHTKTALKYYEQAVELSPSNPIIRYNYGLLLVDLKKYPLAQKQAAKAYEANFPLYGLKNKLKKAGYWPPKSIPKNKLNQALPKKPTVQ